MARNPKFLTLTTSYKLMKLIEEQYTQKNTNDAQFAVYASSILGETINTDHVRNRREDLGIPNNRQKNTHNRSNDALFELIKELEKRVAKLESASK